MKKYFILALCAILSVSMITGCGSKKEDKKEETNTETSEEENNNQEENNGSETENKNVIHFYSHDNEITATSPSGSTSTRYEGKVEIDNNYICEGECNLFASEMYSSKVLPNSKIYFEDDNNLILYDLENGTSKKLGKYDNITSLDIYKGKEGMIAIYEQTYLKVRDVNTGLYGILDNDGNIVHEFNLGFKNTSGVGSGSILSSKFYYSVEGNYIVDFKDDKCGIVKITSNDVVVDYLYEDINIIDSSSYKVLLNGEWTTYNF